MKENKLVRALFALPLIAVLYACHKTMGASIDILAKSTFAEAKATKRLSLGDGTVVPLHTQYFGLKALDDFIAVYVAFFTPFLGGFDVASRMQAIAFFGDLVPLQTIWLVEGIRKGNKHTVAHLMPTIISIIYQIKGIGFLGPLYFFIHYIQCPLQNYDTAEKRMTDISQIKTIIPTVMISYIIPSIIIFTAPSLETRQWMNGLVWQPFPIYAALLQRILPLFLTDTAEDMVTNPRVDMPHLRRTYGFAFFMAAISYLYVWLTSPVSLFDVFFQDLRNPMATVTLMQGTAKSLRYDHICAFTAGAIWTLLSFGDLRRHKKLDAGWANVLIFFFVTTLVAGPGAAMVAMWAWREEILAREVNTVKSKSQ